MRQGTPAALLPQPNPAGGPSAATRHASIADKAQQHSSSRDVVKHSPKVTRKHSESAKAEAFIRNATGCLQRAPGAGRPTLRRRRHREAPRAQRMRTARSAAPSAEESGGIPTPQSRAAPAPHTGKQPHSRLQHEMKSL